MLTDQRFFSPLRSQIQVRDGGPGLSEWHRECCCLRVSTENTRCRRSDGSGANSGRQNWWARWKLRDCRTFCQIHHRELRCECFVRLKCVTFPLQRGIKHGYGSGFFSKVLWLYITAHSSQLEKSDRNQRKMVLIRKKKHFLAWDAKSRALAECW